MNDAVRPSDLPGKGQNAPFGSIERQIARRYLGAKKSEGGVAVIAVISFICIMLAIAAMIIIVFCYLYIILIKQF